MRFEELGSAYSAVLYVPKADLIPYEEGRAKYKNARNAVSGPESTPA